MNKPIILRRCAQINPIDNVKILIKQIEQIVCPLPKIILKNNKKEMIYLILSKNSFIIHPDSCSMTIKHQVKAFVYAL